MRIGKLIRDYRTENGISQREFARRCELSNSLISILEMGVNPQTGKTVEPDMRTYRRLASGMGITVEALMEQLRAGRVSQKINISEEDQQRLEALHQNPRLGLLFDRTSKMSSADVETMLAVAASILKEQEGG